MRPLPCLPILNKTLLLVLLLTIVPLGHADQGTFTNSGGSASGSSGIFINGSTVSSPAGTLGMNCPATSPSVCSGGSLTFASNDGTSTINAVFSSGSYAESCSGGGRGGRIACSFSFTGYFSGTWTVNGVPQAIVGVTSQSFPAPGYTGTTQGTTAFNSAYSPFIYSDTEQILRSDDLMGTNQISYNGSALGGFYGAYGLALDSDAQSRIYVADTYHCRVVRIDDMNGTNAKTFGHCGSGQGQFNNPSGIAVDSAARIYIMDTGNSRLVRIDDMNGANWVTYGTVGSGVGQFATFNWVKLDSSNRIYVADTGNSRIVRIDDMTGANWTTLTQFQPVNGVSSGLVSPAAVAVDSGGKIYVADGGDVVRVDDMTGLNGTSIVVNAPGTTALNSISVDSGGTVYTGGGGVKFVDGMAGVLTSSGSVAPIGSYYVFGVTPVPLPSPRPSAVSLTPSSLSISQNVGSASPAQPVTVYNFGGSPLTISGVSVSGSGFTETDNCLGTVAAGSTCTVNVTFAPSAAGTASGTLTITDNSGNLGAAQSVTLTGSGTVPGASVSPNSLGFSNQAVGTTSAAQSVVLQSTGTGPLQVASVAPPASFSQTNNCSGSIAPGSSCTIQVSFSPSAVGPASGTLTITDNAGTQTVTLSGTGTGVVPVTVSPSSLSFGNTAVGNTSAIQTVTLTNHQNQSLNFTSNPTTSAGFAVASNTCGASIAAGASCAVDVTFSPTAIGSAAGTLTFADDAAGSSTQTVSLAGTGIAPVVLSAATLNYGKVKVGKTSAVMTVTLTNQQNKPLNFPPGGISTSAGFAVASNTCGASIAAGAVCTVGVTFSPTAVGAASGTLTFNDDAWGSSQMVSLSGTGVGR